MPTIPVLNGIATTSKANFAISYPVNLEPVVINSGISKGHLRTAPGVKLWAEGPGADRGAVEWNDECYRVMGSKLVKVSNAGVVTILGDVESDGLPVRFAYSFDRLGVNSNDKLFYWDGSVLIEVTDEDLGVVKDLLWVDGYFMTTDGTAIVVTELNDPTDVDPLKYGSSEADPDPVMALFKTRREVYVLNRYSIEVFQNVGGNGFPFQAIPGAQVLKGCVGRRAKCAFQQTFAFVGSAHNEAISVYLGGPGQAVSLGTPTIDDELNALTPAQQALITVESRLDQDEERLLVHLPNKTLVYYAKASQAAGEPVWAIRAGGAGGDEAYPPRYFVRVYGKWVCGSSTGQIGYQDETSPLVFGQVAGWRLDTMFLYNQAKGGLIRSLELVGLPGHAPSGSAPVCWLSYTKDGRVWSQEQPTSMGGPGERGKRLVWRPKARFARYVGLRVRGANDAIASWSAIEADVEPLAI